MKKIFLFILALMTLATGLSAKKKLPLAERLINKSVEFAGGMRKYQRVETIQYDFIESHYGLEAHVINKGRHLIRLHDPKGLRIREEIYRPEGNQVNVVNSTGTWSLNGEKKVGDSARLKHIHQDLILKASWVLTAHTVKESYAKLSYLGRGFFLDRLLLRIKVVLEQSKHSLPFNDFVAYLDKSDKRIQGLIFDANTGDGVVKVSFSSYETHRSLSIPMMRSVYDKNDTKLKAFKIVNLKINDFIDDNLFSEPKKRK